MGLEFCMLLAILNASCVLVGRAVRKLLFSLSDWRPATDLVLGFLAAPILIAVFCAVTRQPLWVGLLVLDCAALIALVIPRPSLAETPPADARQPLILPLELGVPHVLVFGVLALVVNAPYIRGVLALPAPGGYVDSAPCIWDLQPAIGVTTSLTAYGFPPGHHSAESVPLLYYTGFYVMPAAVAGLAPSLLTSALVGQYTVGSFVFMILLWQLVCRYFASAGWRATAMFLWLSGSTIGVFFWKWAPYAEGTFLQPFIRRSCNHDTIVQFLLWTPRHAIPCALALLVLEAFAARRPAPAFLRSIFFPVVYLCSSSIYVGLWLTPALLVGAAILMLSRKARDRVPLRWSACLAFTALAGLALLPHYYTTIVAFTHHGAPTGRLTTAWVDPAVVGQVLLTCGVGLVAGIPVCITGGRRGLLWVIFMLTLLGAVGTSSFNSDFMCKGTSTLMVLVAFLTPLAVHRLWVTGQTAPWWRRSLSTAAVLAIFACSAQSLVVSLKGPASIVPATVTYFERIKRSEFELIRWVRANTKADQTVSLVADDRTVFVPLFGRPAFAAGNDAWYNDQDLWADTAFLKRHLEENCDLCSGILGSDYVYLSREPMGFGDPKLVDAHFEQHRTLVQALGLSIVKENEAGLIAMNPPRTAEEKRALRAQWQLRSYTNGYHSGIAPSPDVVKWVQVDLGRSAAQEEIRLVPARPTDFPDTPGFGFPVRFRVEVADDPGFANPRIVADETRADFPNPGERAYRVSLNKEMARCVRVTATRLWNCNNTYCFALAELEVISDGKNLAKHSSVSALDSVEGGLWGCRYLVDGYDSRRLLWEYAEVHAYR
jgi:hypothetical protein